MQLKRWGAPVGDRSVYRLFAGEIHHGTDEAWLVTTSRFTPRRSGWPGPRGSAWWTAQSSRGGRRLDAKRRTSVGLEGASVTVVLIERWEPRLGAAIGAAGLLFGLRIGHRLRERPRVRGVAADFDLALYEETGRLSRAVCSFEIDLFNEGELAPGLRGPCVIFYGEEGSRSWCAV